MPRTYKVIQWENSASRQDVIGWVRTITWKVESSMEDDEALAIVREVFGGTLPGRIKFTWKQTDPDNGNLIDVDDDSMGATQINCRLENRSVSRRHWIVTITYRDARADGEAARNREGVKLPPIKNPAP